MCSDGSMLVQVNWLLRTFVELFFSSAHMALLPAIELIFVAGTPVDSSGIRQCTIF